MHTCSKCGKREPYSYDEKGNIVEWPKDNWPLSCRAGCEICPDCAVKLFRCRSEMAKDIRVPNVRSKYAIHH